MVHPDRLIIILALSVGLLCFNRPPTPPAQAPALTQTEPPPAPAHQKTDARPSATALAIAKTVARLRRGKVGDMDHDLSPVTRTLLTRLKHQLRDLITIRLNRPGGAVAGLKSEITGELLAAGVAVVDRYAGDYTRPAQDSSEYVYGDILEIDIHQPDTHPDLVAATTRLSVSCGEDSSLYLFRQQNLGWRLILAQEANGYEDISGAQGWFDYRVSPPDPEGGFFVVAVNVTPWCTSNWQSVRYQVLKPSADPVRPRVLLNETQTIYLGIDPAYTLEADVSTFTLKFASYQGLNPDDFIRPHIVKYRVSANSARRIPPLAGLPDDFLDEWLDLPWNQAARWADPAALPALQKVHAALHRREGYRASGFLFVRPCPDVNQWQIGLDTSRDHGEISAESSDGSEAAVPNQLFFTIEMRNNVFLVLSVSETSPPDCSSPTSLLHLEDKLPEPHRRRRAVSQSVSARDRYASSSSQAESGSKIL